MPIYNGSTQITNIQVPAYTISFWRVATSSEITAAINSGYVKSEKKGESPYAYIYYTIINTNNWRIRQQGNVGVEPVLETKVTETKTEATEVFEKNGSTTTVCYCKRTFTITKNMYPIGDTIHYRTYVQISISKALPMDVRFEFYFQQQMPVFQALPMLPVDLRAGQTFVEKDAVMAGFGANIPPSWSAAVWITGFWDSNAGASAPNSYYYGTVQISNFSSEHAGSHSVTLY